MKKLMVMFAVLALVTTAMAQPGPEVPAVDAEWASAWAAVSGC